jgi:hypothetical protein
MTANPKFSLPTKKKWSERITRSGYFFGAVLLHLMVFILVATLVIFPEQRPPPDVEFQAVKVQVPPPPPKPPVNAGSGAATALEPHVDSTPPPTALSVLRTTSAASFNVDSVKVALPTLPAPLSGTAGLGLAGAGLGGTGAGSGAANNPFGTTVGTDHMLVGTLYDFTKTQDGGKVNTGSFRGIVNDFVAQNWQPGAHPCFISPNKIYTNRIFVPVTPDNIAGTAFGSPESSEAFWLVHYEVNVASNISGKFRFVGWGDNVLVAAIDGAVELDASDHQYLKKKFSKLVGKMNITGPGKKDPTPIFTGEWFDLETAENHHIDILLGDEGGVTTSGLFIQRQDISDAGTLTFAPNGAPKVPLFVVGALNEADQASLSKYLPIECFNTDLILNGLPSTDN